jgi:aspartyl-tRNA(Asn)/glutamyl-tRNA(Gln) amidotransferase subunit B
MTPEGWELVCGLEVHCELATRTKLFCSCPNDFGSEPNTNVCPVCLGLPGSLPVLNRTAVDLAMRIGAALDCNIEPSVFHRKNYFYPDMPKDYQISQYDHPINVLGGLDLPDGSRVGIVRAHIEEDTGKSQHLGATGRISDSSASLVDYNRAGVPLVEIVSAPDIRSAEQARAYVSELRAILVAVGATDGKMEEGSLRVDANVSVRRGGDAALGTRCEIKNLNSLRSLVRAIDYEAARQVELLESGEKIVQETRHWNEGAGVTRSGRRKEEADDYRYFREPDLVPLEPSDEWIEEVRRSLPPLPAARRSQLAATVGPDVTASDDAVVTVVARDRDSLVLAAVEGGGPGRIALNRAVNDLPADAPVSVDPESFTALVRMEGDGKLTATQAKKILDEILASGGSGDPTAIAARLGFEAMGEDALAAAVGEAIGANPGDWADYVAGNDKVAGFFVGAVMKATKGKADGKAVTALLRARRNAQA